MTSLKKKLSTFFLLSPHCNTCRQNETRQFGLLANCRRRGEMRSRRQWRVFVVYDKSLCCTTVNIQQPLPPPLLLWCFILYYHYLRTSGDFRHFVRRLFDPKIRQREGCRRTMLAKFPASYARMRLCLHSHCRTLNSTTTLNIMINRNDSIAATQKRLIIFRSIIM